MSEDGIPVPAPVVIVYFGAYTSRRFFSLDAMNWDQKVLLSGCPVLSHPGS